MLVRVKDGSETPYVARHHFLFYKASLILAFIYKLQNNDAQHASKSYNARHSSLQSSACALIHAMLGALVTLACNELHLKLSATSLNGFDVCGPLPFLY